MVAFAEVLVDDVGAGVYEVQRRHQYWLPLAAAEADRVPGLETNAGDHVVRTGQWYSAPWTTFNRSSILHLADLWNSGPRAACEFIKIFVRKRLCLTLPKVAAKPGPRLLLYPEVPAALSPPGKALRPELCFPRTGIVLSRAVRPEFAPGIRCELLNVFANVHDLIFAARLQFLPICGNAPRHRRR
ncbi:hypothetical protein [Cupriavidus sp. AcVe19-6a]|uniref:hypothetical protein n=1 Tax=Cupriavidus sp. AcVe19-6a TaxID=2821358 RepID=UPI001AE599BF|nr:hypothetical protein [Cupriavidus sp. AcVe19-6a]